MLFSIICEVEVIILWGSQLGVVVWHTIHDAQLVCILARLPSPEEGCCRPVILVLFGTLDGFGKFASCPRRLQVTCYDPP